MVFVEPLRVDRIREGGARANNLDSVGWRRQGRRGGRRGRRKPQQEDRADHCELQKRSAWFFQLVFSPRGIRASSCQRRNSPPSRFSSIGRWQMARFQIRGFMVEGSRELGMTNMLNVCYTIVRLSFE